MNRIIITAVFFLLTNFSYAAEKSVDILYQQHCASCHGSNRLGGMGPALLPENLKRLRKKQAVKVITKGRAATQMPAFAKKIIASDIQKLVNYVYTPLPYIPKWEMSDIKKSHLIYYKSGSLGNKPVFKADMQIGRAHV